MGEQGILKEEKLKIKSGVPPSGKANSSRVVLVFFYSKIGYFPISKKGCINATNSIGSAFL
ncbi:MAG: hypothetical protein E7675_03540 [Ruminococcaceae bacterium]|nr:hypothetical protein [Oscillospiraceae bacterium]